MQAFGLPLSDGGGHRGRLQPVQRGAQHAVVGLAGAALGETQDLVRRGLHQARGLQAIVARLHDLARSPDQHVGVPDGGDAVFGHAIHRDAHLARLEVDWRCAPRLGQRKEWVGHQVLRIARRHVATGQGAEQRELFAFVRALGHGLIPGGCWEAKRQRTVDRWA